MYLRHFKDARPEQLQSQLYERILNDQALSSQVLYLYAKLRWNGYTPIHVAAREGRIEVIQSPIFTSNPQNYTQPLPNGQTPMKLAAQNNHPEVVKMILKILTDMFQSHPNEILNALI